MPERFTVLGGEDPVTNSNQPYNNNNIPCTMFASSLRHASLRVGTRTAATVAGNAAKQSASNAYYQPVLLAAGLTLAATTFAQQVSWRLDTSGVRNKFAIESSHLTTSRTFTFIHHPLLN
jgi:hypothetical protein